MMSSQVLGTMVIGRQDRECLFDLALTDINGCGDIYMDLERGTGSHALPKRQLCEDAFRILDDLGWEQSDFRSSFELTLPAEQLARFLHHHAEHATRVLPDLVGSEHDELAGVLSTCEALLAAMDEEI